MTLFSIQSLNSVILKHADKDNTAIVEISSGAEISYRDLNSLVANVSAKLESMGIGNGDKVIVEANKTISTLLISLAVLRIGAVYVPIDPGTPAMRLEYIVESCKPKLIVSNSFDLSPIAVFKSDSLGFDGLGDVCVHYIENPESSNVEGLAPLAYIVFTSGSTGKPKGVQLTHESILSFLNTAYGRVHYTAPLNYLCVSPFHFDASIIDIFMTLALGGKLVLLDKISFPMQITDALERYEITDTLLVSSILRMLTGRFSDLKIRNLSKLRTIWFGGESCAITVLKEIMGHVPRIKFVHGYGPTELTHTALMHIVHSIDELDIKEPYLPIGEPLDGVKAVLVDENLTKIEGNGVSGELFLGGIQMMRGYINNENRASPFVQFDGITYYRTGDLIERNENGQYFFIGRKDDAVKVMGNLVHLSEIEKSACMLSEVESAIAFIIKEEIGTMVMNKIVLLVTLLHSETSVDVLSHLRTLLPAYMLPGTIAYIERDKEMRLSSGKLDRKKMIAEWKNEIIDYEGDCRVS